MNQTINRARETNTLKKFYDIITKISETKPNINDLIMYDFEESYLKIDKKVYFYIIYQLITISLLFNKRNYKIIIVGRKIDKHYTVVIRNFGIGFNKFDVFNLIKPNLEKQRTASQLLKKKLKAYKIKLKVKTKLNEGTVIVLKLPTYI